MHQILEAMDWSILETDWFLLPCPAQLLTQEKPMLKTGKAGREMLRPGSDPTPYSEFLDWAWQLLEKWLLSNYGDHRKAMARLARSPG